MFSTILDKATGYFDKRTLISSFFPSLVFWGLIVGVFIGLQVQWSVAIRTWDGFSGTIQFLLLFAFFVWVLFWSFITINFRAAFVRLLEGYWSTDKLTGGLFRWRQHYWQNRWKLLSDADDELAVQEALLRGERHAYKELQNVLQSPSTQPDKEDLAKADEIGQELDTFLMDIEKKILSPASERSTPEPTTLSAEETQALGLATRMWWTKLVSWRNDAEDHPDNPWSQRWNRLEKVTGFLATMVDQEVARIQARRQSLYHDLSLYYPPSPIDIMPTRLGNILKATELYTWTRYRLDYTVIWSRLQPYISDTFASTLQDAQTSFDLMITFCAFLLLFGIPISCWIAIKALFLFPWWGMLLLMLGALLFRLYVPIVFAAIGLLLSLPFFSFLPWLIHAQVLIGFLAALLLLYWLSYQSAIQAALNYGEQVKAAFDLYRWKVLENLHLQFPQNFAEERKIWTEVGGLLLRGYEPDTDYYRFSEKKDNAENSAQDNK